MSILIGADFVPTAGNLRYFCSGDKDKIIGNKLQKELSSVDFRIFNLEIPLTDKKEEIKKCGPNLIAPTKAVKAYSSLSVDLLTLANNHILDQSYHGLEETCSTLEGEHIAYVGVGTNSETAAKPYCFTIKGIKYGVYACAEHEFSLATNNTAGANPFDPIESFDHIADLKKDCDYVIVLYHGGKEHYQYPSPLLQKTCRKMIEKGANLVVCQHSHCIGCLEHYLEGEIIYGQGNFLFGRSDIKTWNSSLLIRIDDLLNVSYIPLMISSDGASVEVADNDVGSDILSDFFKRSELIVNQDFVENNYTEFANAMIDFYFKAFSGKESILFKIMNRLLNNKLRTCRYRSRYNEHARIVLENFIECEAHRELIIQGLKKR